MCDIILNAIFLCWYEVV